MYRDNVHLIVCIFTPQTHPTIQNSRCYRILFAAAKLELNDFIEKSDLFTRFQGLSEWYENFQRSKRESDGL